MPTPFCAASAQCTLKSSNEPLLFTYFRGKTGQTFQHCRKASEAATTKALPCTRCRAKPSCGETSASGKTATAHPFALQARKSASGKTATAHPFALQARKSASGKTATAYQSMPTVFAPVRYLCASNAAFAPSPAEMMVCLYGIWVTSPAAKMPGTLERQLLSTRICPC